jgi:hypothetical protein
VASNPERLNGPEMQPMSAAYKAIFLLRLL